ncbi:MAG: EamA family transporter [Lentisphaeria bacterium]|nr:EamA family transporter [Lentisphaeria bacterium]
MAVVFAFCCLGFAAFNDLVFKFFARRERSRGVFIFAVGVILTCLLLVMFVNDDWWGKNWKATLLWGTICGLCSVVGNIFLIESMSRLSAGVCSTVYRLNLALVIPLAVLCFHESPFWYQWIGVALALAAVLAFMPVGEKAPAGRKSDYLMLMLAMALRAGMGIGYKYAFDYAGAAKSGVQIVNGVAWIVCGLAYYLLRERKAFRFREAFSPKVLGYGALSGVLVTGIIYFMAESLAIGDASIVLPIQQMSFLATFFLSVAFLKEKVTIRKVAALVCGVAALLLLSIKPPAEKTAPAADAVRETAAENAAQP